MYREDRLFVRLRYLGEGRREPETDEAVRALEQAGHPVVDLEVPAMTDLGGELYRWMMATAVSGIVLGVNPFDEPDVKVSKEITGRLLEEIEGGKATEQALAVGEEGGIEVRADTGLTAPRSGRRLGDWLKAHLERSGPRDYVAWLAYLPRRESVVSVLEGLRRATRDRLHVASTLGFGPRFQHSTGQYHKGGTDRGIFVQLTCEDSSDLGIPGVSYGFSTLKQSQARGDFEALQQRGRRVMQLHITGDLHEGLKTLEEAFERVHGLALQ